MLAVRADLRQEIEAFLYHEARLIDDGKLDDWLALFVEDLTYWIPCNEDDIDPNCTHIFGR